MYSTAIGFQDDDNDNDDDDDVDKNNNNNKKKKAHKPNTTQWAAFVPVVSTFMVWWFRAVERCVGSVCSGTFRREIRKLIWTEKTLLSCLMTLATLVEMNAFFINNELFR
jgi:hypothetical protein